MQGIEVRLFGRLHVRRADGSLVRNSEWSTSKTKDLLRLLALEAGTPVSRDKLVSRLWPDADEQHAGASLRTAACRLRRVLGPEHIGRLDHSLMLDNAWVDTQAFGEAAEAAERARRVGDHRMVVQMAREAETLYPGDLDVAESDGDWFETVHDWRDVFFQILLDGADSAASLAWMRDSLAFARKAHRLDPSSERAVRATMRAHSGLGETTKALRSYSAFKTLLNEQYGVDPSPQTQALLSECLEMTNLQTAVQSPTSAVESVSDALQRLQEAGGTGVLWLRGEPGSGRRAAVATACRGLSLSLQLAHRLDSDPEQTPAEGSALQGQVLLLHARVTTTPAEIRDIVDLARRRHAMVVIPVETLDHIGAAARPTPHPHESASMEVVEVGQLSDVDLERLIRVVLQAEPSPTLVQSVSANTNALAERVIGLLRRWLAEERLVWTAAGMQLSSPLTEATAVDAAPATTTGSLGAISIPA
ncbi:hypothetical protein N802_14480 [Knoellia sinensis KCTC 19936]|uniref:Bacterial transcriptional activator domain-containing protein n=1 Tax=Knoellia sinensis KCTC 19936 TaxID=1385520 RepID=A0A0A0JBL0_9MICO|nr:BTAD domain-containing putative transcriptional regulator [Knoellia sinensis]KGN33402.1 hypothetical protein N802_14480 [Knoellia sinensis KCTC 19936]